jgi:hypothetical protein
MTAEPRIVRLPSALPPFDDERTTPPPAPVDLAPVLPLVFPKRPRPTSTGPIGVVRPLPPPGQAVAAAVMAVLEVQSGLRPLRHLASIATPDVVARLERRARLTPGPGPRPSPAARLRRLRVTRPSGHVAEVAAVVGRGERVSAIALRMDWTGRRWIVTAIEGI